jgi:hypothetical protein
LQGLCLKQGIAAAVALAAVACSAPAAMAGGADRYAEPGGDGPEPCLEANPCNIEVAVESAPGSTVVHLLPGDYSLSDTLTIPGTAFVTSDGFFDGSGTATITVTENNADGVFVPSGASSVLTGLEIVLDSTSSSNSALEMQGGLGQGLTVSTTNADRACNVVNATLSDSYCSTSRAGGVAAGSVTTGSGTGTLRNVTATAVQSNGVAVWAAASAGNTVTLNGRNVIALSNGPDENASAIGAGAIATVDLTFSNFSDMGPVIETGGGDASITLTGEDSTNQDDPSGDDNPHLVSPHLGDAHQMETSPTIDAGSDAPPLGSIDIDADMRFIGDAPDIGADEFVPLPADTDAPDTEITKKPKKKSTKRKAKLKFESSEDGSTFECKLDKKPFKACDSPFKKKVKASKKHKFLVRAIDAAGNTDPTPAKAKWKVLAKD